MRNTQIKKRHHYVMQNYLGRWKKKGGEKNNSIWVKIVLEGKIFHTKNLKNIAQKKFFYELRLDRDIYELLLYRYGNLSDLASEFRPFLTFVEFQRLIQKEDHVNATRPTDDDLYPVRKNFLENEYAKIENSLAQTLSIFDANSDEFLTILDANPEHAKKLVLLFFLQAFRTPKMRRLLSEEITNLEIEFKGNGGRKYLTSDQKMNFIKSSLFIDSINQAYKMVQNGFSINLLLTSGGKFFITSDEPAILTKYDPRSVNGSSNRFEGYMPLTPCVAMILSGKRPPGGIFTAHTATQEEVEFFNQRMEISGCTQLYAFKKSQF